MKPPPSQSLGAGLKARVGLLATRQRPSTVQHYQYTVKSFLTYLRTTYPEVRRPSHLRRDPHVLGWLGHLWMWRKSSGQPLCASTRAAHLIRLRKLFDLLADHAFPPLPGLLLSEDIPRLDQLLPRPLAPADDARLQEELRRRNDLLANGLLLIRLTGVRIGEGMDMAVDCLRHWGDDRWAVHVPLGKLHTERWVPVGEEVHTVVTRLLFLRTLPGPASAPAAGDFLLPRGKGRDALGQDLRAALRDAARQVGITAAIVPHQLRHTYATTMLRAGVSLPALMKLLGHRTANMTLRYVEITQQDLEREFHLARQTPRYLVPVLPALERPEAAGDPPALVDCLRASIAGLDLYRQQNATSSTEKMLRLLHRRLVRIRSAFEKLVPRPKGEK
jgi:site-specific recombinase XerD